MASVASPIGSPVALLTICPGSNMKDNTQHTPQSTPIPTGIYDLDTLKTECETIGIEPTRPNIRRMRRAIGDRPGGNRAKPPARLPFQRELTQAEADDLTKLFREITGLMAEIP